MNQVSNIAKQSPKSLAQIQSTPPISKPGSCAPHQAATSVSPTSDTFEAASAANIRSNSGALLTVLAPMPVAEGELPHINMPTKAAASPMAPEPGGAGKGAKQFVAGILAGIAAGLQAVYNSLTHGVCALFEAIAVGWGKLSSAVTTVFSQGGKGVSHDDEADDDDDTASFTTANEYFVQATSDKSRIDGKVWWLDEAYQTANTSP